MSGLEKEARERRGRVPERKAAKMIQFLVHNGKDNVGVATVDIEAGDAVSGLTLDANKKISIRALEDIPLGHKIALRTLRQGETAIKYGHDIGRIIKLVKAGRLVHVHNLKTKRW